MDRTHHRGLDRLDRVVLIVRRRGGAGEVVDLIDLEFERLGHIVADQFEIGMLEQVGDIAFAAGEKVVEANHLVALAEKPFAKMGAQKARSAGDQDAHGEETSSRRPRNQGPIPADGENPGTYTPQLCSN